MESNVAIQAINVTKTYRLYEKPVDRLKEGLSPLRRKYHREFFALRGLNLDIVKGQTVGIIGKNGSGKSTFLKILTGILSPTAGSVEVNGRISALLELGAGFNPEYSGLQNIYLNGSMMGYSKTEIDEKLSDILDFADIADFVYQPVKSYSSGMFVRLAFALAVSVDPEILIVDEALSVGDIRFQQKCFRRIREFKERGTVLFVSHDVAAVRSFCDRVVWLNEGMLYRDGAPDEILDEYHAFMTYDTGLDNEPPMSGTVRSLVGHDGEEIDVISPEAVSFGELGLRLTHAGIFGDNGTKLTSVIGDQPVELAFIVKTNEHIILPLFGFTLKDRLGNPILVVNTEFYDVQVKPLEANWTYEFRWKFRFPRVRDGVYTLDLAAAEGTYSNHIQHHWISDAIILSVKNKTRYPGGQGFCVLDNLEFNERAMHAREESL